MYNGLTKINAQNYNLDNFSETNRIISNIQEENFKKKSKYNLLSLLCIALIDLGLIEVEYEN